MYRNGHTWEDLSLPAISVIIQPGHKMYSYCIMVTVLIFQIYKYIEPLEDQTFAFIHVSV